MDRGGEEGSAGESGETWWAGEVEEVVWGAEEDGEEGQGALGRLERLVVLVLPCGVFLARADVVNRAAEV